MCYFTRQGRQCAITDAVGKMFRSVLFFMSDTVQLHFKREQIRGLSVVRK